MSVARARRVALRVIARVRRGGSWAHEVLSAELEDSRLDERDAALATRLAYGTVEMGGVLDEVLAKHLKRPSGVEPKVLDALRLSTYELLCLRTPAHVAVDQGVEMVGAIAPRAKGLANAVLRRIAEEAPEFPFGDADADPEALARLTGFPYWLATRLTEDLGWDAASQMMRAHTAPAPLYLAHNPFKGDEAALFARLQEAGASPESFGPAGCIRCGSASAVLRSGVLAEGLAIVADAAAQAVVAMMPLADRMRVIDIAAGRGGKSALMHFSAARSGFSIEVVATDIHGFKTDVIAERMRLLGVPRVTTACADASDPAALSAAVGGSASADIVLVDAPCTGTGTLRRHPDKRWRLEPAQIAEMAALGAKLLASGAGLVRSGGFVVYSTCTVIPEENTGVVDGFLGSSAGEGFEVVDLATSSAGLFGDTIMRGGMFQTIPEIEGFDGHFAALLRRR
ncbi:MAG: antitermination protein NusB [Actinobacteria bacterium]|nr:antitermination protein NusB [Actinomycetota bacterium]